MSDSNQNQLSLEIGIGDHLDADPTSDSTIDDSNEIIYRVPGTDRCVSEHEIDRYVDARGCSYDDAFRHFGVRPDDMEPEINQVSKPEHKKHAKAVIANNLGKRAIHLLKAASDYKQSMVADGLVHDLLAKGDEQGSDRYLDDVVLLKNEGDSEFYKAWYPENAKKVKPLTVDERFAAQTARQDFYDLSTNPDRAEELNGLIKSLSRQKSQFKAKDESN